MTDAWFIAQQTLEIVIAVLSVLGNSLVLYVIKTHPPLQNITNYLIASLAMADLLVGLLGLPCVVINNFGLPYHFYGCLIMSSIIVVCTQISIFSLLAIAIERFLAIRLPIFHRRKFSRNAAGSIIAIAWVAGALVGFVPVFGWNDGPTKDNSCDFMEVIDMSYMVYFNFFGFVLVPLLVIYATYGYIFYVVHSKLKAAEAAGNGSNARNFSFMENNQSGNTDLVKSRIRREWQAVIRVLLIVVLFSVCWLPIHIMNSVYVFLQASYGRAITLGVLLSHANSFLNPLLYAYTNVRFKEAFLKTLRLGSNSIRPNAYIADNSPEIENMDNEESEAKY